MEFTRIGVENHEAFSALLPGTGLSHDKIYIGVIEDNAAVGAGEFSSDGNLLVLDSIFVAEDYRRRGIGSTMLSQIADVAVSSGAGGIWADYVSDEVLDGFLVACGFVTMEDSSFYRVPIRDLLESEASQEIFGRIKGKPEDAARVCSFADLSSAQLNNIKSKLVQSNIEDVDKMIGSLPGLETSIAVYKDVQRQKIGAVMITDAAGEYVTVKYIANMGGSPKDLAVLLKYFYKMTIKNHLTYKTLSFCTDEQEIKQIITKFAGYELMPTGSMMVAYRNL
ncbi:MAG: GNAT family N-acetyltransferase [Lachnospiraceae bacterium]|nr:GNAT family N-acetyltransferase [Lachnospiraceae bacterium]